MNGAMRPAWLAAAALAPLLALPAGAQQDRQATQHAQQARPATLRGQPAQPALQSVGQTVPAQRQAELRELVLQDCGSCHGMRLTGGLGPALTAQALRDRPVESLVATIVHGRPGTAMPPWDGLLTQAEAAWIVERLIEGEFGDGR